MVVSLAFRNMLRRKGRLAIVALALGVMFFAVFLTLGVNASVQSYAQEFKNVSAFLQLRAAGSMGHVNMVGNDKLIPADAYDKVKAAEHVTKIERYLLSMRPKTQGHHNFAMHIGLEPGSMMRLESHGEVGNPRIIAGRDLTREELAQGADVAIIGKGYAEWLGITQDTLPAKIAIDPSLSSNAIYVVSGASMELDVVGIFVSGYVFGDLQLYMPYDTFKKVYPADGISWLYVTVDSAENVPAVSDAIRELLGKSVDIKAPRSAAAFESATSKRIQKLSAFTIINAMLLAIIVIFLTMTLITRERIREIGTLKALGMSDAQVTLAFALESLFFVLTGAIVGVLLYVAIGSTAMTQFFTLTMKSFLPVTYESVFEAAGMRAALSPFTIVLVVLGALVVGILGSMQGLHVVRNISPREAMQHE